MNFMNELKNETNKQMTFTENGALAYQTSGKKLLDFLFATTALRHKEPQEISNEISGVYFENPTIANPFYFYMRDCRGGMGERKIFRTYLMWLANNKSEIAKNLIPLVPEYGRWDDLWCLLDTTLKDDVCAYVEKTLNNDIELAEAGKPCSILAKWLPSCVTSSRETCRYGHIICDTLGLTPRQYRKILSKLRKHIDVVEVKMSANEWSDIKYENVPSQANALYKNAFMRHDEERRIAYLDALVKGETKINASVLQPHEICRKYGQSYNIKPYDETVEQLWKALPVKNLDNCLVVRDGSGSMCGTPLEVATALAIYMADHNNGIWKDKFITFSANPKFIDLSYCKNLHDKLIKTYDEDDCSNTDIEKTMMLILNTAIKNHCKQEDMPANVLIISDMKFDAAVNQYLYFSRRYKTMDLPSLFDSIAERYKSAGYKLPRIVFWNVRKEVGTEIPMQKNDLGVVLLSGYSVQLLDMVMSGEIDPYKVVLEAINAERYDAVREAVANYL